MAKLSTYAVAAKAAVTHLAAVNGVTATHRVAVTDFESAGAATAAVTAHEGALDPHSQYLTPAEGDAAYEAAGAVATHAAAADPHPGYLTPAEGNAAYEAAGAVATHAALADPHPGYLTPAEGNAAYQPLDADLTQIAALVPSALQSVRRDAAGTAWEAFTPGSGGGGDMLSTLTAAEIAITTTTTLTISRMHVCSGTTANYTVTLPAVSGNAGKFVGVRMATGLTKLVTIDGNASEAIDGALTRIMWAGEAAILLCDGSNWFKVAGKSIPFFVDVSVDPMSLTAGAFTKLAPSTVNSDAAGLWDNTNKYITVPRPAGYDFQAKFRMGDNYALRSYGLGVHNALADGAWFDWFVTVSEAAPQKRNGAASRRLVNATAGSQYFGYYYIDGTLDGAIGASAQFVMSEIPAW